MIGGDKGAGQYLCVVLEYKQNWRRGVSGSRSADRPQFSFGCILYSLHECSSQHQTSSQLLLQVASSRRYQHQISCSMCAAHQKEKRAPASSHVFLYGSQDSCLACPSKERCDDQFYLAPLYMLMEQMCLGFQFCRRWGIESLQERSSPVKGHDCKLVGSKLHSLFWHTGNEGLNPCRSAHHWSRATIMDQKRILWVVTLTIAWNYTWRW